jgi:hypothetical protein
MRRITVKSALPVLIFLIAGITSLNAQSNVYKLQSLFMYNFVKSIKWENVGQEFVIGVYGSTIAYNEVKANIGPKNINGISFKIVLVNNVAETKDCHLLYIPKSNQSKEVSFLNQAGRPNLLIVTEEDHIASGASISFEVVDSKLGFIINKQKTDASGLKVSSSLMSLGKVV